MADEVTTGADPAAPTATSADASGQPDVSQTTTQTQPTDSKPFTITREEWLDKRREDRATKKMLETLLEAIKPQQQEPPKKGADAPAPDARSEIAQLRAEMAFDKAVLRLGIPLTESQLEDLSALYSVQKPENPGEWLAKKVEAFGLKKPPAATPAPSPTKPTAPAANARSDAGAPATTAAMNVAGASMAELDVAALKAMTPEQRRQQVWPNVAGGPQKSPFRRTGGS